MAAITTLRRAFVDICRGYSVARLNGRSVYIRHLSHFEHSDYEDVETGFKEMARVQGAPTEAQRLDWLYVKGTWSPDREQDIARRRERIGRMQEARKTVAVPSILQSHEEQIKKEQAELTSVWRERTRLIGETVESDAARRLEDYYIVHNLFADAELSTLVYDSDAFDNLTDAEVEALHALYATAIEPCADENLRRLAVQDWFISYWTLGSDDARAFYGRAICDLTYYQVRLANYARYYKALLEHTDMNRIPEAQRGDPDAIERLHITQKNQAQLQAEGKTPVGMTSQDIKEGGHVFSPTPPVGLSGIELARWMMKNQRVAPR